MFQGSAGGTCTSPELGDLPGDRPADLWLIGDAGSAPVGTATDEAVNAQRR
jgi:hypothetical protein